MNFAAIFDMDGVLVQSLTHMVPSYNSVLQRYGCKLTQEEFAQYNGRKIRDIVAAFNTRYSLQLDSEEFAAEVNEYQVNCVTQAHRSYAQEKKFILDLAEHGVPCAVATSSRRSRAVTFMSVCGYEFEHIVTGEDVQKGKPAPDIFLAAARRIGYEPASCIVFEDALTGLLAARAAGMKAVGINSLNHSPEELRQLSDLVVDSIGDLAYDCVKKLFQ